MDQADKKTQLLNRARLLLSQARYASPINQLLAAFAIAAKDVTETELENICQIVEEHNQKQEEVFATYKAKMETALKKYANIISASQKTPVITPNVIQVGQSK